MTTSLPDEFVEIKGSKTARYFVRSVVAAFFSGILVATMIAASKGSMADSIGFYGRVTVFLIVAAIGAVATLNLAIASLVAVTDPQTRFSGIFFILLYVAVLLYCFVDFG